jgi:hypothetical protein
MRLSGSFSSVSSTLWTCNTFISAKVIVPHRNRPGVVVSILSIVHNISFAQVPGRRPPYIMSANSSDCPSTRASAVLIIGSDFGFHSASMRASIGGIGCQSSSWVSGSLISGKSSVGLINPFTMPVVATLAAVIGNSSSF